jgi:hypothetical protein
LRVLLRFVAADGGILSPAVCARITPVRIRRFYADELVVIQVICFACSADKRTAGSIKPAVQSFEQAAR